MINQIRSGSKSLGRVCGNCGSKLFSDAPEGLCSVCLFKTGLGSLRDAEDEGALEWSEPLIEIGFDDYELLEELGRGGQGVVYRAHQKSLNRTVALKVIGLGQWAKKAHVRRFRLEAEAAAKLDHPCIVPIHEVGEADGCCYFSMNLVEGEQLDEVISSATADSCCGEREPMLTRRSAELIAKLARAVDYAHEHGILHRDIKPGNILLDAKGEPHLTDFGLARLVETESSVTRTLDVLGTPSYMAPEQAMGNNAAVSSATDVYGLGAVLYQLLTGQPPFAGGTTYETMKLLLDTEPRPPRLLNPKIDRDLSTICLKCLEKDPTRRYSSALALAEDVERWLKHQPIRARQTGVLVRGQKWVRRNPITAALAVSLTALATVMWILIWKSELINAAAVAALLTALAAVIWALIWKRKLINPPLTTGVAVLPFENMSSGKGDTYFVDGMQDDILTRLAKIADLKVMSRSSVMRYRAQRNIRQIGDDLRVSHVLEGSVRRQGNKLQLNARLIDTHNNALVWAEKYETDLNGMFAIENAIARKVAQSLHVNISANENAAINEPPTSDLMAYDLYLRATSLLDTDRCNEESVAQAVGLLGQAIARDAAFLLAYCRLASAHDTIYFERYDRTPGRLTLAKSALDIAFQLNPDSGEAHLALATHLYVGYFDYDQARKELAIALRTMPNNARIFALSAYIDRTKGRWADAVRNFERAIEREPQNKDILVWAAATHSCLRQYGQARELSNRLMAVEAINPYLRLLPGWIDFQERAEPQRFHADFKNILMNDHSVARLSFLSGLYPRDGAVAARALAQIGEQTLFARWPGKVQLSRAYARGIAAEMKGDVAAARAAFYVARAQQEKLVLAEPDDGENLCVLGLIDAALGRKDDALWEGRRAAELLPLKKDAVNGAEILYFFAAICARTGEYDLAIEQLETLAKIPAGVSYGEIRLDPNWDPLRGNPRFEKIAGSLAPK